MIKSAEIQQIARNEGVRDTQIEKDYILSWILTGISNNENLFNHLLFKGGMVLKKFYFKDYRYSEVQFDMKKREMIMKYSDLEPCRLQCYSLEEVMIEKMRSLLSRQQPRDFYDLWYLSENEELEMSDYLQEFETKTKYKGLAPSNLEIRINQLLPIFKARWSGSLSSQIRNLPPFEQVSRDLGKHFRKLFKHSTI